ncbi:hypothetical protein [uncultured Campylobacter sp.]|uniref:hypothetical protein n=1 Tax=uncultured Campylobacter sp. TaxID=218934 RepID=UPI002636B7D8|nr:hypothetical protein [uncultured Campylobacter sp.]
MRSLFLGEICAATDKFKFTLGQGFEILFSRVLLGDVKFPSNSAVKILNGKIPPSKILSNEALLRKILLGRNSLLVASSRKIPYPWIYERKISARKISFFEILQALPFKISQALFRRASTAPRSIRALNFASQNPLVALTNVASENSCAMQAVKFIKFTGSASSSETVPSLALTAAADRTQAASFTAANFAATKAAKEKPVAIKAIIAKVEKLLNLETSRVFARLKNGSDLKEASRAH